jgi:hypothetical protein
MLPMSSKPSRNGSYMKNGQRRKLAITVGNLGMYIQLARNISKELQTVPSSLSLALQRVLRIVTNLIGTQNWRPYSQLFAAFVTDCNDFDEVIDDGEEDQIKDDENNAGDNKDLQAFLGMMGSLKE